LQQENDTPLLLRQNELDENDVAGMDSASHETAALSELRM
jgi:hypothetical protein